MLPVYSRMMRNWETRLALQATAGREETDYRVGADWFRDDFPELTGDDDLEGLARVTERLSSDSGAWYRPSDEPVEFVRKGGRITFQSRGVTPEKDNKTAYLAYRPIEDGRPIVLALPHWNAARRTLRTLLPLAARCGFGGAALSLPYQDERMPADWGFARKLVSADLGLTVRAMQQAVLDAMDAISILQQLGHRQVLVLGFSFGSGVTALLDAHDPRPVATFCVLCADSFADCTWNGASTVHLRERLEVEIDLPMLRRVWRPMEFRHFTHRLNQHPRLTRAMLTARYDLTFPYKNGQRLRKAFRNHQVAHTWKQMACGHYTLGQAPFSIQFALWLRGLLLGVSRRLSEARAKDAPALRLAKNDDERQVG
ncbi:MAG: hypothetical protein ACF8PN_03910 [Phycisphaerales bacterium]